TDQTNWEDAAGGDLRLRIPEGTSNFINQVLSGQTSLSPQDPDYKRVASIEERRQRLTENNLIVASSFSFSKTTKQGLTDNNFYVFRTKLESAGNLLSLFASASQTAGAQNSAKQILGIAFSQYAKTELEYIKHWDLNHERVVAIRGFVGIAIPYGNSESVPFSRSYFAGGSNDIRAWQPYSLGPGRSGSVNDFNEANLKLTLNAEYRFKILNSFKGAFFVDAGNIWNVLDNVTTPENQFTGLRSLDDIAVGSGFGFRYDLSFFVVRIDMGFKTFNPAVGYGRKWFRDYNFSNAVLNIGINYPF
ncbi:MAG TPA: BamA/TamA family outer membrane protein, partial [Flavobacterium sp.]|nr:BamA/TamA family outer membrane protein [Flavobacterium sp.]